MTDYWVDMPQSWAADGPVHAHATRTMQRQANALLRENTSRVDCGLLGSGYYLLAAGAAWAWCPGPALAVRAIRKEDGTGWRSVQVELGAALDAAGTSWTRAFLLPLQTLPLDPATGACGEYPYLLSTWTSTTFARKSGTIAPLDAGLEPIDGVTVPVLWLKLAVKGGPDLRVYDTPRAAGC